MEIGVDDCACCYNIHTFGHYRKETSGKNKISRISLRWSKNELKMPFLLSIKFICNIGSISTEFFSHFTMK